MDLDFFLALFGKGNEKGDVERDIRSYTSSIKNRVNHDGIVFRDWDHLNECLMEYMLQGETDNIKHLREEEQKKMRALPS